MSNLHRFLVAAAVICFVSTHLFEASGGRVLNQVTHDLVLQSVQKGEPTPPSDHNGCTHITGSNDPRCINGQAFAGRVRAPPRLQPERMVGQIAPDSRNHLFADWQFVKQIWKQILITCKHYHRYGFAASLERRILHHFLVIAAVILLASNHLYEASGRILNNDELLLQSVQKAKGVPTPPSRHNGCTHIPGRKDPPCIRQRAFAGHATAPSGQQPIPMVPFHAAA
ncbi:hypothetical protein V6N11_059816 [Hibiscus sabdariffa]|uniref:Secreted protein n=1 Tax=Hibiscus sabdariffa TaxID=183260 RepID=A0ABR2NY80_9ROSI